MATIKLILRDDKKSKDGSSPIYLRITENRKSRYLSTSIRVSAGDWNEARQEIRKSNPNHVVWNDELTRFRTTASTAAIEVRRRTRGKGSAASVKRELLGKGGGSVLAYAKVYADRQADTDLELTRYGGLSFTCKPRDSHAKNKTSLPSRIQSSNC